ncbi:MAG TPA: GNAT family N-acetyltransferase [Steroidobacteraceae bacterium]|nr:GNAT family N-acetyltransferase [Steroidobacteraceae bacterium]
MTAAIRLASQDDAGAIREIYAPFCDTSLISFEYAAPSTLEIASRVRNLATSFPWLILESQGVVAGYAYASRHHERAGYGWSVDVTVYISPSQHRRGAGRALYTTLFQLLRLQGFYKAYAGITLPNAASTGLHEAMGFQLVGVYKGVGYKFGGWHDVAHYQLALQPERAEPTPALPLAMLIGSAGWADALAQGIRCYDDGRQRSVDTAIENP